MKESHNSVIDTISATEHLRHQYKFGIRTQETLFTCRVLFVVFKILIVFVSVSYRVHSFCLSHFRLFFLSRKVSFLFRIVFVSVSYRVHSFCLSHFRLFFLSCKVSFLFRVSRQVTPHRVHIFCFCLYVNKKKGSYLPLMMIVGFLSATFDKLHNPNVFLSFPRLNNDVFMILSHKY